jgi:hypothetical protein
MKKNEGENNGDTTNEMAAVMQKATGSACAVDTVDNQDEDKHEDMDRNTNRNRNRDREEELRALPITETSHSQPGSVRHVFGSAMHTFSDFVNQNLITIRYATLSSVLLLGAYSISQTPLFFRYRTVKDIPNSLYQRRHILTCRAFQLEHVTPMTAAAATNTTTTSTTTNTDTTTAPIILYVRHLSPVGRLLSKGVFEWGLLHNPTTAALGRIDSRDLLRIQLFGLCQDLLAPAAPPFLLEQLVQDCTRVRCQLLALTPPDAHHHIHPYESTRHGRPDAGMSAIARVYYRERTLSWSPSIDLGSRLVQTGWARIPSDIVLGQHGSTRLEDKQRDIQYLESLSKLQSDAILNRRGMWSIPKIRESAQDLIEHAERDTTTSRWYHKLWRRLIRGT